MSPFRESICTFVEGIDHLHMLRGPLEANVAYWDINFLA